MMTRFLTLILFSLSCFAVTPPPPPVTFIDSIVQAGNRNVSLSGDSPSPGDGACYSTNSNGVRGWYTCAVGTVVSVGLSDGSSTPIYGVSGSPVSDVGTLILSLLNQSANTIFAGPSSGSANQPGFRSLVNGDLPVVSTTHGGTGVTSLSNFTDSTSGADGLTVTGGTGAVVASTSIAQAAATTSQNGYLASADWTTFNGKQNSLTFSNSVQNSSNTITLVGDASAPGDSMYYGTNGAGTKGWYAVTGSSGTVTSVGLSAPAIFSVTGSPVTTSGTLTISLGTESANTVFAGPTTGSAAAPSFRAVVGADIPTLNQNTTGTAAGNTSYTPNQYGVVLSGSGNTMSVLTPVSSTAEVLASGGASANPAWTATPTLTSLTLTGQLKAANGTLAAPSNSFSSELSSGFYWAGTGDVIFGVKGDQAMEAVYINPSQVNLGFGPSGTVSASIAVPVIFASTFNGTSTFNYVNQSTGTSSATVLQIGNGTSSNFTTAENWANSTGSNAGNGLGYLDGGSAFLASPNQTQLVIGSENTSGFIGFTIGGRTLTKEAMRLTTSSFTLNKGWGTLNISGSTSGILTFVPAAVTTSYTLTWPSAVAATAGSIITSSTGGALSFTAQLPIANGGTGAATASANTVFAGPTTGSAAAPSFRAVVGADLPNPSATTLGGIESAAPVSNEWITSISTSGVPALAQPAFSNISGVATIAQGGTDNGSLAVTSGGVFYSDGTKFQNVGAGITGQFLQSSGAGTPAWASPLPDTIQTFTTGTGTYYLTNIFTISSSSATAGWTYTNNGSTCTVEQTISSATQLIAYCTGAVNATGTLTCASGCSTNITYTQDFTPIEIDVQVVGGGGGGGASHSPSGGASGNTTTFGSSLISCTGGAVGSSNSGSAPAVVAGGTCTLTGVPSNTYQIVYNTVGGYGSAGSILASAPGGNGGGNCFNGGGAGGVGSANGSNALANTGGGGGGAGADGLTTGPAGGGAAGGCTMVIIRSPGSGYSFSIGGTASGASGTFSGGTGAAGGVTVREKFF